jgi:hypothetical protein
MTDPIERLEQLRINRMAQLETLASLQTQAKDVKDVIASIDAAAWALIEAENSPQEHLAFGDADPTDHEVAEVQRTRAGRRKRKPPANGAGLNPADVDWGDR